MIGQESDVVVIGKESYIVIVRESDIVIRRESNVVVIGKESGSGLVTRSESSCDDEVNGRESCGDVVADGRSDRLGERR